MWKAGTPITLASTNVKQVLSASIGLVKAVRIQGDPGASGKLYVGGSTLDPAATPKVGVIAWSQPPVAVFNNAMELTEVDCPNGINLGQLYVAGTAGDVVLWSYVEQ